MIDALKEGAHIHDSLFWLPAEKQEGQLADPGCYAWYLRAAGVRLAVLAELAGAGEPLAETAQGAACLVRSATAAQMQALCERSACWAASPRCCSSSWPIDTAQGERIQW